MDNVRPKNESLYELMLSKSFDTAITWEALMRRFSKDTKPYGVGSSYRIFCENFEKLLIQKKSKRLFSTGSSYEGTWNALGLTGTGTYTFPNGVIYAGEFEDNDFHGEGEMRYPDGTVLRGIWDCGQLLHKTIIFADNVHYSDEDWTYCKMPDRRFASEYYDGLRPAPVENQTITESPIEIPPGYYDAGDGFYHPESKTVFRYDDLSSIVRSPDESEQQFIIEKCRTRPCGPVGPMPSLYEEWIKPDTERVEPPSPCCLSGASSPTRDTSSSLLLFLQMPLHILKPLLRRSRSESSITSARWNSRFNSENPRLTNTTAHSLISFFTFKRTSHPAEAELPSKMAMATDNIQRISEEKT